MESCLARPPMCEVRRKYHAPQQRRAGLVETNKLTETKKPELKLFTVTVDDLREYLCGFKM